MNKGIWFAIGAYGIWGFLPLYLRQFPGVGALEILFHRIGWSLVFIFLLIALRREGERLRAGLNRQVFLIYLLATLILSVNWFTYTWAVVAGHVLESSLGYFINPMVNVLLGVVFLRERLRPWQWVPVGLAAAGVLYLTVTFGTPPYIALTLAVTFGLYGFVKKKAPLPALHGLLIETGLLALPAIGYLTYLESQGAGAFGQAPLNIRLLFIGMGIVTAVPLLFFAAAAQRVPLTTMGIIQYISPTLQFLSGIFIFHEDFNPVRLIGFSLIWLALIVYSAEGIWQQRKNRLAVDVIP